MMLQFDQIAVRDSETFSLMDVYKRLGHNDWKSDRVESYGVIRDSTKPSRYREIQNVAELRFNYTFVRSIEFELLHYVDGPNFLESVHDGDTSHFGAHVESIEQSHLSMMRRGFVLVQEVITQKHQAFSDRNYHYAIYNNINAGFYWKLIERIKPEQVHEETNKVIQRAKP